MFGIELRITEYDYSPLDSKINQIIGNWFVREPHEFHIEAETWYVTGFAGSNSSSPPEAHRLPYVVRREV